MTETLVIISFAAGLVPSGIMLWLYGFRTAWETSTAGRTLFGMILITVLSYALSLAVTIFPDVFRDTPGEWVRIGVRLALAGGLWFLLRLFLRAQRGDVYTTDRSGKPPRDEAQ